MAAVENWFDQVIPIISERQVTQGGPVITIQNENEYPGGWDASMRRYIEKLNAIFRKHDIEVPILACNVHGASKTTIRINYSTEEKDQIIDSGMILTYNHHVIVEPVYELKSKQPDAPLITSEFWGGHPVYWGVQIRNYPNDLAQARAAYEYASTGTQVVYYMFEGGTNFGFWGGNNIATSYAASYPVGEGGKLMEKYYAVRPANLFASQFADDLADSVEAKDKAGIQYPEGVRLVVRTCSKGAMAFLSTADKRKEIALSLPSGKQLTVHMGEVAAAVVPLNLEVFDQVTVDYSNLTLLAKNESRKVFIVFGPAGTEGVISVNGNEMLIPVGRRKVEYREIAGIRILVADEEMARRCWIIDDQIVFGPDFAGEENGDGSLEIQVSDITPEITYLDTMGQLVNRHIQYEAKTFPVPELASWKMDPCAQVISEDSVGWRALEKPCSHEKLGVELGYLWYCAELDCKEDGVEKLLLPHAPNRVSVFVNGQFCGTHAERRSVRMRDEYAHPADWAFEELTVQVKRGRNRFVFLSDNLGHNYDVPIPVGIQGPVFLGSRRVEIESFRETSPLPVTSNAFNFLYNRAYREPEPLPAVEFELSLEEDQQAFIMIHGVHAWVTVNGEEVLPMSYPESPWTMFAEIKRWISWHLPKNASGRANTVRIQYIGDMPHAVKEHMTVYVVPSSGECTNWHWQPWEGSNDFSALQPVKGNEAEKEGIVVWLPIGSRVARKGRILTPSWFESYFPMPEGEQPVYLKIGEMQKGQIFLNGRNAGRFWRVGGTQEQYYLPRSWMKENNHLVIFEELGLYPQNTSLAFGNGGTGVSHMNLQG
jgi:hypothetical protein